MTETLSEMLARHQQEIAALVGQMTEEAHKDGMRGLVPTAHGCAFAERARRDCGGCCG